MPVTLQVRTRLLALRSLNVAAVRIIPTAPNFSITPAKSIDAGMGASTCATVNHPWKPNMGTFTKNPPIIMYHNILLVKVSSQPLIKWCVAKIADVP